MNDENCSKETAAIRKEKWKKVKQLRDQDKYAIFVYDGWCREEKRRILFPSFLQWDI